MPSSAGSNPARVAFGGSDFMFGPCGQMDKALVLCGLHGLIEASIAGSSPARVALAREIQRFKTKDGSQACLYLVGPVA